MKSCLIVDDSRVIRKVARQIFESIGFSCEEAENGEAALTQCRTALPDFILLDWQMPVMDGMAFIQALRKEPNGEKPLVVFCTNETDIAHITQALDAGANEYIMKPFDSDIIRGKLELLDLIAS
ncbi:MAG TPA: response regulator [Alphaproteobacteria bacterium]|nr:response regulator [Alphaproteobacteria bacterium]